MNHTVQSVFPMEDFILGVKFSEGAIKLYDMNPLFSKIPAFTVLKENPDLFDKVTVDTGGKGIVWNDELDLSAEELWEHGWPEWKEEDLVTIEFEIEVELLQKATERLKPYGLTPEDWIVMSLELLVFPRTEDGKQIKTEKSSENTPKP